MVVRLVVSRPDGPTLGATSVHENLEASAGFEPAVEVLQPANCSSPAFAEVHCVLNYNVERSVQLIAVRQSSAALPSPLPSSTSTLELVAEAIVKERT
jgi:hypothetical protein